jgi:hypothetical protein
MKIYRDFKICTEIKPDTNQSVVVYNEHGRLKSFDSLQAAIDAIDFYWFMVVRAVTKQTASD